MKRLSGSYFPPPHGMAIAVTLTCLLVSLESGDVAGVRVVSHRETPGLGDAIDLKKSDWVLDFDDTSLQAPAKDRWLVKKDGGDFDQFTGATVTPRAVVVAVRKALEYTDINRNALFGVEEENSLE